MADKTFSFVGHFKLFLIISAILLILIACGLIWGTDAITGFIKGLFM